MVLKPRGSFTVEEPLDLLSCEERWEEHLLQTCGSKSHPCLRFSLSHNC